MINRRCFFRSPDGHPDGLETGAEGTLWVTSLQLRKLSQVDSKDFHVIHNGSASAGYVCRID